jgi:hypothetical protein
VGRWKHYERHLGPLLDVLASRSGSAPEPARSLWEFEGLFPEKSMEPDLVPASAVSTVSKLPQNLHRVAPHHDWEKK